MLLGGLWHGANWTFILWGAIHGAGLAVARWLGGGKDPAPPATFLGIWVRRILVFHFVCLAWVFFRAESVSEAFALLAGLGRLDWRPEYATALQFLVLFTVPLFLLDLRMERYGEEYPFENAVPRGMDAAPAAGRPVPKTSYRRRVAVAACAFLIVALFAGSNPNAFIYFQF
jgi:hypothetical protein